MCCGDNLSVPVTHVFIKKIFRLQSKHLGSHLRDHDLYRYLQVVQHIRVPISVTMTMTFIGTCRWSSTSWFPSP
jgi:hypothetical protein